MLPGDQRKLGINELVCGLIDAALIQIKCKYSSSLTEYVFVLEERMGRVHKYQLGPVVSYLNVVFKTRQKLLHARTGVIAQTKPQVIGLVALALLAFSLRRHAAVLVLIK